jgi:hypothetical protein
VRKGIVLLLVAVLPHLIHPPLSFCSESRKVIIKESLFEKASVQRALRDHRGGALSSHPGSLRLASVSEPAARVDGKVSLGSAEAGTVLLPPASDFDLLSRDPLKQLTVDCIKPLYTDPIMPGEGVWETATSPRDRHGGPIVYKTFYRPSVQFPNAIVYMMVIDLSKVVTKYYVGSQEPAAPAAKSRIEDHLLSRIVAITNAMWMQRHSMGAGAIFRGKVIYPMVDGMATLIIFKDGSVDIQEWSSDIPMDLVQDARQLRHLIVKNGLVVRAVVRDDRLEDSEIGLGFLLGGGAKSVEGEKAWYVAHRSAFGIRQDGNLVFAIGHHVGTQDMAKALVLAGCERAIHADANPANIVANLYLRDANGNLMRKMKLSPHQSNYTLKRYENGYTKDFFVFFSRAEAGRTKGAQTKRETAGKFKKR